MFARPKDSYKDSIKSSPYYFPSVHKKVAASKKQPSTTAKQSLELPPATKQQPIIFRGAHLNHQSSFNSISQYLAEKYLLKPYPDEKSRDGIVQRHFHGVLHASCATYTADNASVVNHIKPFVNTRTHTYNGGLFIELLKKYLPTRYWQIINELNGGEDLTDQDFTLLKLAIYCHDTGNTSEVFKDEKVHADIFTREMLALGFPLAKVRKYANAIANKDAKGNKNILQMIIHDADCLEITRVLSNADEFDLDELDIVKLMKKYVTNQAALTTFSHEIRQIVNNYYDMVHGLYESPGYHEACEHSKKAYEQIEECIQGYRILQYFRGQQSNDIWQQVKIPDDYLEPMELYNPAISQKIPALAKRIFTTEKKENEKKFDMALSLYKTQGLYIRRLNSVESEIDQIQTNKRILDLHKIKSADDLKKYFTKDQKTGQMSQLPGFKFRPATVIKQGVSINDFEPESVGLLITPNASSVLSIYFYKRNMLSNFIDNNFDFDFERPGGAKDVKSFSKLVDKLLEVESRRRGIRWDNYNRNYGNTRVTHNETLMTYGYNGIVGIVVGNSQSSVLEALKLRLQLKNISGHSFRFYQYSDTDGLIRISDDRVMALAGYTTTPVDSHRNYSSLELKLKANNIQNPNEHSLYAHFHSPSLKAIQCSLATHSPSSQFPVTYSFENADMKGHSGRAYVKNGIPVIEIHNIPYYDRDGYLQQIAMRYQREQIDRCNRLLGTLKTYHRNTLHVDDISLSMSTSWGKSYFILEYQHGGHPHSQLQILDHVGYDYRNCKWNIIHDDGYRVQLRLAVLQSVDAMRNTLSSRHDEQNASKRTLSHTPSMR